MEYLIQHAPWSVLDKVFRWECPASTKEYGALCDAEHVVELVNHDNTLKVPRTAPVELLRLTSSRTTSLSLTHK